MLKIGKLGFDSNNWPEGVWGQFAEGVKIKVRKLTAEALRELRKPLVKITMELESVSRRMVPAEKVDTDKYDEVITDYLIEDFQGIGDEEGNPLPVTLESKKQIMNYLPLKDWIWAFAQTLEMADVKKLEEEGKNS